jgi:hypothetical protein
LVHPVSVDLTSSHRECDILASVDEGCLLFEQSYW